MTGKMIGKHCATGPGGRDCTCCGQAPGKARKKARRSAKRADRTAWKREVNYV